MSHYSHRIEDHVAGVDQWTVDRARRAENWLCVDCGNPSLGGGLRCYTCFSRVVARSRGRKVGIGAEGRATRW